MQSDRIFWYRLRRVDVSCWKCRVSKTCWNILFGNVTWLHLNKVCFCGLGKKKLFILNLSVGSLVFINQFCQFGWKACGPANLLHSALVSGFNFGCACFDSVSVCISLFWVLYLDTLVEVQAAVSAVFCENWTHTFHLYWHKKARLRVAGSCSRKLSFKPIDTTLQVSYFRYFFGTLVERGVQACAGIVFGGGVTTTWRWSGVPLPPHISDSDHCDEKSNTKMLWSWFTCLRMWSPGRDKFWVFLVVWSAQEWSYLCAQDKFLLRLECRSLLMPVFCMLSCPPTRSFRSKYIDLFPLQISLTLQVLTIVPLVD